VIARAMVGCGVAAGLHRQRSEAVFRYTGLELRDRYELLQS